MSPGILFVCHGNICRSPMAVGIARKRLGNGTVAESAGIAPSGGKATEEAVLVMKAVYGVDISDHKPRGVADVDLAPFDYVIALDLSIYTRLKESDRVPKEKLFGWDIEDPIGLGYQTYKQVAKKIEKRLEQFLENRGLGV
jgi:protein-tyrosine-phosphatase